MPPPSQPQAAGPLVWGSRDQIPQVCRSGLGQREERLGEPWRVWEGFLKEANCAHVTGSLTWVPKWMMTQTFRRPSLTQLCDTHDPPSPLSGWVPATTTALLLPFPASSSPPQGPRCSFGLLAWPAPTLPIRQAFLDSLANRSLPHPTTLFVSFWHLAMAEIPRAWILGRCHGPPRWDRRQGPRSTCLALPAH